MSRFFPGRALARNLVHSVSKPQFAAPSVPQWTRLLSQSAARPTPAESSFDRGEAMMKLARTAMEDASSPRKPLSANLGETLSVGEEEVDEEPYHFHIMTHRHNTHVTVTKPNRDAIISVSGGNLGFKKAARGTYDAAYQVGAYVIDKLHQMGVAKDIQKLEVVYRGFGQGREAVTKVLLSNEGKALRDKIIRVSDSTRTKFGGTRGRNPRRV